MYPGLGDGKGRESLGVCLDLCVSVGVRSLAGVEGVPVTTFVLSTPLCVFFGESDVSTGARWKRKVHGRQPLTDIIEW